MASALSAMLGQQIVVFVTLSGFRDYRQGTLVPAPKTTFFSVLMLVKRGGGKCIKEGKRIFTLDALAHMSRHHGYERTHKITWATLKISARRTLDLIADDPSISVRNGGNT